MKLERRLSSKSTNHRPARNGLYEISRPPTSHFLPLSTYLQQTHLSISSRYLRYLNGFSNLPSLQIDQLTKLISVRLLKNRVFFLWCSKVPSDPPLLCPYQRHVSQDHMHCLPTSYPAHNRCFQGDFRFLF